MNIPPPRVPPPQRAFSLVEVAIALGIIGVALTSLLALMPVGLTIFRESLEATVQADILRQLSAEFQKTPFTRLQTQSEIREFSDEGTEVAKDGFLGVSYVVSSKTSLLHGSTYENSNLKKVCVSFYTRQDLARGVPTPNPSLETVLFVSDNGQ